MSKRYLLPISIILLFTRITFAIDQAILFNQANEEFLKRNFKEAEALFEKYLVLFPDGDERARAQYLLGEARYQLGEYEDAIAAFKDVCSYYPKDPIAIEAKKRIGDSYERLNQKEKALKAYNELLKEHPNTKYADYANYSISWLKNPDLRIEPKRGLSPKAQLKLANEAFNRKEYEKARLEFETFLKDFPEDEMAPYVKLKLAECDYYLGRYKEAIPKYRKIVDSQGVNRDYALYSIGWCHYRLKEYKEALSTFERLKDEFPKSRYLASLEELLPLLKEEIRSKEAEDLYIKAKDEYKKGNIALAFQRFEELINNYPESPHLKEAKAKIEEIKETTHPEAERRYKEASRLREGGDYDAAIEGYRRIISEFPSSEYARLASHSLKLIIEERIEKEAASLWTEAERLTSEGRFKEAMNLYQEIIDRYPTSSLSKKASSRINETLLIFENEEAKRLYEEALTHLKEERPSQAITEFEKIILTYPKSNYVEPAKKGIAEARLNIIELKAKREYEVANEYYRLKDYKKATDEFQKVILNYPETNYAKKAKIAIDEIAKILLDKEAEEAYNLARRYYSEGQPDNAFKEFKRLIDNYPESKYRNAALEAMAKISKQMVDEAAKELYDRGRAYQKTGDYNKAIGEYEALLKRYPTSYWTPYAQYAKAESFYVGQADYMRAIVEWMKVVDNFPTHELAPHALYHIGECYEKVKEWQKARAIYRRLVEEYPQSMYGHGELAQFIKAFLSSSQEEGIRD